MRTPRTRLREKLIRELAQSERDARIHTRREARRLGTTTAPAQAFLAIADHADATERQLVELAGRRRSFGVRLGHAVAGVFSGLRHLVFDRLIDTERSYRATILGLRHGIDVARLLHEVAMRERHAELQWFCSGLVIDRGILLDEAESALSWFAEYPDLALRSGTIVRPALRA